MSKTILLIGENATDHFIIGKCQRLAPEGPVPVVEPIKETSNPGMAANVMANINSLAPDWTVHFFAPSTPPIQKIRYIDEMSGQLIVRVDVGDKEVGPLNLDRFTTLMKQQADAGVRYDAIVFSEYGKGFLTTDDMAVIAKWAKEQGIPVFADTKQLISEWAKDITVIKINRKEADAHGKEPWPHCENVIVTEGSKGCYLDQRAKPGVFHRVSVKQVDVRSVAGCGDSFLAGLVVSYLEQGSGWKEVAPLVHEGPNILDYDRDRLLKAMDFANKVAAVAASKPGVVAVKREEVV